jgi:3-oxoacyl-[acyl-carrier protein] reductase
MSNRYLVFGATGGIGSALCRSLLASGHQVALSARNAVKLGALASELGGPSWVAEATRWDEVSRVVSQASESLGGLDGVAVCVGSLLLKPAHLTTQDEFEALIQSNLTTSFGVTRAAAKAMLRSGGSIVLVASAAAQLGFANHDAIAAVKAGVMGLTRSAAATYAPRNIRVNCVAPGLVQTPLAQPILQNEAARLASEKMHPLGRLGEPADIARAMAWLMHPDQQWITGQTLGVDGGLSSLLPRQRA